MNTEANNEDDCLKLTLLLAEIHKLGISTQSIELMLESDRHEKILEKLRLISFDKIPEDKKESHPCPECGIGDVIENFPNIWECSYCPFNRTTEKKPKEKNPLSRIR